MSAPPDLVPETYVDAFRVRRRVAPEVRAGVLEAMGLASGEEPPEATVALAPRGSRLPLAGEVTLEDGSALGPTHTMPPDAPFGYHEVTGEDGRRCLLLTGPGRCHLPAELRAWGWVAQLAATRSRRSWGIGDLGDLRELAEWSASVGAGFVAVSPMGAPNPGSPPEPSPYFPSTRRFGNPLHLRIADTPGAADVDGLAELAEAGRGLDADRLIDRSRAMSLKREALELIWAAGRFDREAFGEWRRRRGEPLTRWARFVLLCERLGPSWRDWPHRFRDPAAPAVIALDEEDPDRLAFHAWVQWCFDLQLAAASVAVRRIADMPVGVDPSGFDAWDWQEQLASGATVGAPPDRFNTAGQDWGLPPFVPHRLRHAGYRPFIETIRAQLRHAGGLRIDHALGLFRLWWIPPGRSPAQGAYVTQPTDELLEIVAIESHRAGAVVVGEDLGTVPSGVRAELRRRRLLSTRLALFERRPPARYPRQAYAGVTTHDLPTMAGIWSGADLRDQAAVGVQPDPKAMATLRSRLVRAAGSASGARLDRVVVELHRALAASPAMLVAATLEDALRVEQRPNLPGTIGSQRTNWSLALPVPIEELAADPGVRRLVGALRR